MKIIHGNDYYDNAHCGIDPDVIFVRNGELTKPIDNYPFHKDSIDNIRTHDTHRTSLNYNFTLGWTFCAGEVYPMVRRIHGKDSHIHPDYAIDTTKWNKYNFMRETIDYYYNTSDALVGLKESKFSDGYRFLNGSTNSQTINDHFATRNPKWPEWLIEHGIVTGYLMVRSRDIIQEEFNTPCLGDVDFYSVIDPYTTNQNIAGYIGGVLASSGNPMVALKDKDKIKKAGFDYKSSFRKAPTKHR